MYQIEYPETNTEVLKGPRAQKMLYQCHHQQNVLFHERTKCPYYFHSIPCSRGDLCPNNSPGATRSIGYIVWKTIESLLYLLFNSTEYHKYCNRGYIKGIPGVNFSQSKTTLSPKEYGSLMHRH